jgi:hypothetical protein
MKKRTIVMLMLVTCLGGPLYAVLGIGDVVFDPTSYANAVLMMGELVKSYEQLRAGFNLQTFLATTVPVEMSSRYRMPRVTGQELNVPYDRFGNLGAWVQQINRGGQAQNAYSNASMELRAYGSGMDQMAADERLKVASQYASIELTDGTNIESLNTIGRLHANAQAADQALAALESDSLSSDPAMNSEIAVLNKINAATIAQIRTSRDTNQLLVSALSQQLADSKRRRDAEVSEINSQILRLQKGATAKAVYTSTVTETLQSFRWR